MTFKPPFTDAEKEYIKIHQDEWPSVLAYKVSQLFGIPRTERGVREILKKLRSSN